MLDKYFPICYTENVIGGRKHEKKNLLDQLYTCMHIDPDSLRQHLAPSPHSKAAGAARGSQNE
jgi:hypothetical protein